MKLSIKNKLIAGFLITMLIFLSATIYMADKFQGINLSLNKLVNFSSQKIRLSNEIMIEVLNAGRHEKNILIEKDALKKEDYKRKIDTSLEIIDKKYAELQLLIDENGMRIASKFHILWDNYKPVLDSIISLCLINETQQALELSIGKGQKTRDESLVILNQLIEKNKEDMVRDKAESEKVYNTTISIVALLIIISILISITTAYWIIRSIGKRVLFISNEAQKISNREFTHEKIQDEADDELTVILNSLIDINESFKEVADNANMVASGNYEIDLVAKSENDVLGKSIQKMMESLHKANVENKKYNWLTTGKNQLSENLISDKNIDDLLTSCITFLSNYIQANIGAMYLSDENNESMMLVGKYAFSESQKQTFAFGEGLIGQVAKEQKPILVSGFKDTDVRIVSTVMDTKPNHLFISPVVFEGKTLGVVELGKISAFTETEKEFILSCMESIGVVINSTIAKEKINKLLAESNERGIQLANAKHEIEQQLEGLNEVALVSITDIHGNITYVNDRFVKVSKYEREELIGKNHRILKSGRQPDGLFVGMWKAISAGRIWSGEITNKAKDGTFYWVDTTIIPILNLEGKLERFLSVRFDITKNKEQQEMLKQLNEELREQQEELKQLNEELEEQAQNLKQQQEELQTANEELEEQTQALEQKNKEVEKARYEIEHQARQIELSSKYKSEFLANMSHELRTPLNSLLILSRDLAENKSKNLTEDQVESAEIIYKGGNDLLALINEVLDLSKIEAGKMSLNIEPVNIKQFSEDLYKTFKRHTEQKGLSFHVDLSDKLPVRINTDTQRLNQILKNLISNAIKFTDKGSVSLKFELQEQDKLRISVADTGVGIPQDKQKIIFEAFQQAEGGTSRKYGGTGLGLSISRELAKLLGGEITLQSKSNEGSVFTLIIPLELKDSELNEPRKIQEEKSSAKHEIKKADAPKPVLSHSLIDDDRDNIDEKDKIILIIEDDVKFAEILKKQAKQKGFKCLAASSGEEGLMLAKKHLPHAIILDLVLPGISGHNVLTELKSETTTRHIPVHIVSVEERSLDLIKEGAIEFLTKPVYKEQLDEAFNRIEGFILRKVKNLLIVEDDDNARKAIKKLIGNGDVKCLEAATGKEALDILETETVDCIILDLGLPDISGFEIIKQIKSKREKNTPPIIVYTGRELSKEENSELQKYAESIIIKGVKSEERLLDETALFLHRTINNLPESKQEIISNLYDKEKVFQNKKILLVDDDMRNLFALSKILKEKSMEVIKAENGLVALELLEKNPDIDMVLMDIMMPEMDGYEAMRRIRAQEKYEDLPIIAITAKAMKEDKQKCLDAGANDYIPKPVDVQRLLSLMRVWLSK